MKRPLLLLLVNCLCFVVCSAMQDDSFHVTVKNMEEPYEVAAGQTFIVRVVSSTGAPTLFSYSEAPDVNQTDIDPAWKQWTNYSQNDGAYEFEINVNEDSYVWAGAAFGVWQFSPAIHVSLLSGVTLSADDGLLCDDGEDGELLTVEGTFASYEWFFNGDPVENASTATLEARQVGRYRVRVDVNGEKKYSNTVHVRYVTLGIRGSLSAGNKLSLQTDAGFTDYHWMKGTSSELLTDISGATSSTYEYTLTSTSTHLAVRASKEGCAVQSEVRPADLTIFAKPSIIVDAEVNEFNRICSGTTVRIGTQQAYDRYEWFVDGQEWSTSEAMEIFETATVSLKVAPAGWPEISMSADNKRVEIYTPVQPVLFTDPPAAYWCPGETATIFLDDQNYQYTWYMHEGSSFGDDDVVDARDGMLVVPFEKSFNVSVVANSFGCESKSSIRLASAADQAINIQLAPESIDDPYICPGSTGSVLLYATTEGLSDLQWYKKAGDDLIKIEGAQSEEYRVREPGVYVLQGVPDNCNAVVAISNPFEVLSRSHMVYQIVSATDAELCKDEKITLSVPSSKWTNVQWFEQKVINTNLGPAYTYVPFASGNTVVIGKHVQVMTKATYKECPAVGKISSEPFIIRPAVNPWLRVDGFLPTSYNKASYDSIPNYLFCDDTKIVIRMDDVPGIKNIKWYRAKFNSDDNYILGDLIPDATGMSLEVTADYAWWYTVQFEYEQNPGCITYSHPILIDTWVFHSPIVSFERNGELCDENDKLLITLFDLNSGWTKFRWYKDNVEIEGANEDKIYTSGPGLYRLETSKPVCPDNYMSTNNFAIVMFPEVTIERNDTVIYALPEEGTYTYKWFEDGVEIENEPIPWVIHLDKLKLGKNYTVEVSNGKCSGMSDPYLWAITGADEHVDEDVLLYPNPTNGMITIQSPVAVEQVRVFDSRAHEVRSFKAPDGSIDLSSLNAGVFVIDVHLRNGRRITRKFVKQ